jgi:hypothetical protein
MQNQTINLKTLNTLQLDQRIKSIAQAERNLLKEILLTIQEIDTRRMYLELGFGSLFDYLVTGVGYSEGSAQRRIDAARLIREIPAVAEKIQSGELKLNQVSLVQKTSREIFKKNSKKVTSQEKLQVIDKLLKKNHSETQKEVASFFDLPIQQETRKTIQADDSVRLELTLSKEAYSKIKRAQELLSHSLHNQDPGQFFEFLAEKVIQQKIGQRGSKNLATPNLRSETASVDKDLQLIERKLNSNSLNTATVAVNPDKNSPRVAVRPSLKAIKQLKREHLCCQYVEPRSGQKCRSTWKLQVDHKHSVWASGSHQVSNLQILCAAHNKFKYRKEVGVRYTS